MKEFIEYLVKALVDNPDEVNVTQIDGEKTVIFELRCNQSDIGKVIGKQGRTIKAIRTLRVVRKYKPQPLQRPICAQCWRS